MAECLIVMNLRKNPTSALKNGAKVPRQLNSETAKRMSFCLAGKAGYHLSSVITNYY
jgi:hypothetical protein